MNKNDTLLDKRAEYIKNRVAEVKNKTTEIKRISRDLFISESTVRRDLQK